MAKPDSAWLAELLRLAPEGWLSLAQRGSSAGPKAPRAPGFGHGPRAPRASGRGLGPWARDPAPGPRAPDPEPPSSAQQSPRGSAWRRLGQLGSGWLSLALPAWAARSTFGRAWAPRNWPCLAQFGSAWLNLAQRLRADIGARGRRGPQPRRRGPARPSTNQIRPGRARRHRQGFGSHAQAWPLSGAAWLSLAQLGSAPLRGSGGGRAPARRISGGLAQLGSAWLSLAQLAWGARAAVRPHAPARWPDMVSACLSLDGRPSSRAG